jgi:hypothetical protein
MFPRSRSKETLLTLAAATDLSMGDVGGSQFMVQGERAMRKSASKTVVIPPVDHQERPIQNADRPLWALNGIGQALVEKGPQRQWDGATIPTERFVVK